MISFYLGVAARRPFLNRSTSQVPAANPSGTFLHVRPACVHMLNIKLSGFNPSHVSFHASPFHCLPPLLPYVVAWLHPLPGMHCIRVQPTHWSPPLLSCKPCNMPCLFFALAWLVVQDPDTSSCTPRVHAWTHGFIQLFFQPCTCCACVWLLHRWSLPCMHTTRIGLQYSHPTHGPLFPIKRNALETIPSNLYMSHPHISSAHR
jgi:hypothetical protein